MCQAAPGSGERFALACIAALLVVVALRPAPAHACGCLSPPIPPPMPGAVDFAVNQQAEQIIFEVEPDGHIVAHVLIRYAGDPKQFAWIVPVPSLPELELSHAEAFGFIDQQTRPTVSVTEPSICPAPLYVCKQHPMPVCGDRVPAPMSPGFAAGSPTNASQAGSSAPAPTAPPVTVLARQQVGSYDTVVFDAGDAQAAVDWLQSEGFIVNDTMSPYMEPYVAQDMLFVAAKLVPGAGADEIRPLRMRYEGTQPMIPLQLTAVATEPNLTVTAYIYAPTPYAPVDQTLLLPGDLPRDAVASVGTRNNYPMLLSRLIDEDGGRAFMLEYVGAGPRFMPVPINRGGGFPGQPIIATPGISTCCDATDQLGDPCNILHDQQCQCPLSPGDADDCAATPDLVEGMKLAERLAATYPRLTRITTRMSAEEMTFDPMFDPAPQIAAMPRLSLVATNRTLGACTGQILEDDRYSQILSVQACATTYCGRGRCVSVGSGVGCVCDPGHVARRFTDLDGEPSLTCVPETAPVDLEAGGIVVPDVCETLAAEDGQRCVNLAGFPGIRCGEGEAAALVGTGVAPTCLKAGHDSGTTGARNYTLELENLRVCAPSPPACDARFGWLEPSGAQQRASVERCPSSIADASWLQMPEKPTCLPVSNAPSGSSTSQPRPASITPERDIQTDTTKPRAMKRSDDDCSATAAGAGRGWLLAALAGLVLLALALRRARLAR